MKIFGKPVVDATRPLKLVITKQDIDKAQIKDPFSCAAALAATRQLKAPRAKVHLSRLYVEEKNRWLRYETTEHMEKEIVAFDRGGSFEPGIYTLAVPPRRSIRLKAKGYARHTKNYSAKKTKGSGPFPQKGKRHHTTINVRNNAWAGAKKK